jgi:hypothetical protein
MDYEVTYVGRSVGIITYLPQRDAKGSPAFDLDLLDEEAFQAIGSLIDRSRELAVPATGATAGVQVLVRRGDAEWFEQFRRHVLAQNGFALVQLGTVE